MEALDTKQISTSCCIAGGGPAGMMLGFLLARAGVDVVVLEKHKDFFRDFRGDTIHPSTSQLMYELGILDDFLKVPHQLITELAAVFNGRKLKIVDATHLPTVVKALGLMPQWDFLNFIKSKAEKYPSFHLMMEAEATGLIKEGDTVRGVVAKTPGGDVHIKAGLVVGTDGRHSTIREKAGLKGVETATPIDVLWFRLLKQADDPSQVLGWFDHGQMMVMLDRNDYWQCAYIIEKGGIDRIKQNGLEPFRNEVGQLVPFLKGRMDEIKSLDTDISLLSVAIDHLVQWYDKGVLCIGDAAHAMSPIGGVGINLAVQDAVATANLLYKPLKEGKEITTEMLEQVQKRREFPMRVIQKGQAIIQNGIKSSKEGKGREKPPFFLLLLNRFALLRRIPAYVIGIGIRPEHIRTPEVNETVKKQIT